MTTVKPQQRTRIILLGITTFKDECDKCSKVYYIGSRYTTRLNNVLNYKIITKNKQK